MLYTIKNKELTVVVSDTGAELISAKRGDCEYVWVADPNVWPFHSPLVFPVCGRFQDAQYTYQGKIYNIDLHGFIRPSVLTVEKHTDTEICLALYATEATKKVYPFDFTLKVWYILEGNKLTCRFDMANVGENMLPITMGGHPGFNVPLDSNGAFEDYYLEFSEDCSPDRFILSERYLMTGKKKALPLEDSRILRLRHDLFDNDAVFMSRMASSVTLKSDKTDRYVTVSYADMPYLGVWHNSHTEAPFVCIEPWCGLPGVDSELEDLETRADMFRILPGKSKSVEFSMLFG